MKKLVLLSTLLFLGSCGSFVEYRGTPNAAEKSLINQIQTGMTPAQVTEILGEPYMITNQGNQKAYTYMFRRKFVKFVYVFLDSESHSVDLSVYFINDKVVEVRNSGEPKLYKLLEQDKNNKIKIKYHDEYF